MACGPNKSDSATFALAARYEKGATSSACSTEASSGFGGGEAFGEAGQNDFDCS